MKKCIKCGHPYEMPKDRTICYLCSECRNKAVMSDPQYTTDSIDIDISYWNYDMKGENDTN